MFRGGKGSRKTRLMNKKTKNNMREEEKRVPDDKFEGVEDDVGA